MLYKALTVAAAIGAVAAQGRPENTSICDYYTTALLTNNTATNQKTLLTLVVNTAVIGNYTTPNVGIKVDGILDSKGPLLGYFNGTLASSNRGGDSGVAINFLDGGGAAALMNNTAAFDEDSNQYTLLTHLYEYFGGLLGCSMMGTDDYASYDGEASMFNVHKFMVLDNAEVQYFITQVANSAASFGVAMEDITVVGTALNTIFGVKYGPAQAVLPPTEVELQSICIADDCPTAVNATESAYPALAAEPATTVAPTGTSTPTSTSSPTSSPTSSSTISGTASPSATGNSAAAAGVGAAAVAAGIFAALL